MMFLMFVSPTVSLKNKVSTRLDLTIRSKGITRSNRPNLNKMLQRVTKGYRTYFCCLCVRRYIAIKSLPSGLADVSVPNIVCQDALGLILQHLHTPGLRQACGLRFEQDNCLHTATLCGVWGQVSESEQTGVKL